MNGDIGDGDDRSREKSAGNGGKIGAEMVDTRRSHLANAAAERTTNVFLLSDGWTRHADVADGRTDVGGFGEYFGYFTRTEEIGNSLKFKV